MTELRSPLEDDLAEIARGIPRVPRAYSALRSLLALLPQPPMARNQPSLPVDEIARPESAADQLGVEQGIGTIPGSAIMDGSIHSGQIGPGAVTGAKFASTVKPVILVHGLPTLPDANYPVDTFVYDIDASPKTLWKNVANVWTRAVGPSDIQADSITAGQLAAGAVSTSELAVGARLTGEVANETGLTPGVFIDSTGILIRSGKLTLQDEFGLTTLQAAGFNGSWFDFVTLGLYNARFTAGVADVNLSGRTANLPYWTATPGAVGTLQRKVVSGLSLVRATFTGLGDMRIESDKVPVHAKDFVELSWSFIVTRIAGTLTIQPFIRWYTEAGGFHSDTTMAGESVTTSVTTLTAGPADVAEVPDGAAFAAVILRVTEATTHNAGNQIDLYSVSLVRKTTSVPPSERWSDASFKTDSTASGTYNDWTPSNGSIDLVGKVRVSNNLVLTGIAAPRYGKRRVSLYAYGGTLTLLDNDSGSASANRFSLPAPGSGSIVIPNRGAITLMYDDLLAKWTVEAVSWPSNRGTAFPGTPKSDDLFFRTDLGMWFQYDGTRWLCCCPHSVIIHPRDDSASPQGDLSTAISSTSTSSRAGFPPRFGATDHWNLAIDCTFIVAAGGTALGASHKWVGVLTAYKADGSSAGTVGTVTIDSGASNSFRNVTVAVNALRPASAVFYQLAWTKTGTPGDLSSSMTLSYRVVAT